MAAASIPTPPSSSTATPTAACLVKQRNCAERSSLWACNAVATAPHYRQALVRPNMMMVHLAGWRGAQPASREPRLPWAKEAGRGPALLTHTGHARMQQIAAARQPHNTDNAAATDVVAGIRIHSVHAAACHLAWRQATAAACVPSPLLQSRPAASR